MLGWSRKDELTPRRSWSVTVEGRSANRWASHPLLARSVRIGVLAAPLLGSFAFVHYASYWVRPPAGSLGVFLLWWFALSTAATVVLFAVDRFVRRLLPLAALLQLSLIFPDETPSRFRVALSSGNVQTLEKRLAIVREAREASTPREAALRLLELVAALSVHDRLTRGHSERVRAYSGLIAKELGLGEHDLELLNWAALLHDIGKLEVPQSILTKPGKPTDAEWEVLRQHPLFGEQLTAGLRDWLGSWWEAVGYHHERWDGKGYPRALSGDGIPLPGRIVAVADVYDVITSARSYKAAGNSVEGREEIAACAGTQFDPRVVRAFLNVSLGRMRLIMGPLSWLSHLPLLGRIPLSPALAGLAGTAGVVAAVAATGTLAGPAAAVPAAAAAERSTVSTHDAAARGPKARAAQPEQLGSVRDPFEAPGVASQASPASASLTSTPPPTSQGPSGAAPPTSTEPASNPPSSPSHPPVTSGRSPRSPAPPPHAPPASPAPPSSGPSPTPPPASPQPAAAVKLAFSTEPTSAVAGTAVPIAVSVQDAANETVATDDSTTVALSVQSSPAGGSLACTNTGGDGPVTVVSGVATFSCSFEKSGSYQLMATDSSPIGGRHPYTSASSSAFNITAGAPAALAFTGQPSTAVAGSVIAPAVQVSVVDAYGNLVASDSSTSVTLAIGANPGAGTLSGTTSQTVSSGTATFADLSIASAGSGYTLSASSSPALTGASSSAFNITAGAPAALAFTGQPSTAVAGSVIAPAVQVSVVDAYGNLVASDSSTSVTLAIGANPGAGTLSGTTSQTVSSGTATFADLSIASAGSGYTLSASSSPALTGASSSAFNITAGAPAALAFTGQPSTAVAGSVIAPAVQVSVVDAYGNLVASDSSTSVTLAIGANPGAGTLSGTTSQTVSSGTATFADLSIASAGSGYTLSASSSPALMGASSSAFNITAATPVAATLLTSNSESPCTSGASCTTASVSPPAGTTLLILVQRGGSTTGADSVSSISGPFASTSEISSLEYPTAISGNYLFAWTATANGSNEPVKVNFASGSNANPTVIDVIELSGNNTSAPVAQQATASSLLLTATGTLESPNAANAELLMVSYMANASLTTPHGFTALDTLQTGSNGGECYGLYFSASAQASTSVSSSGLGLGWGTIAIEINRA